MLPDTTRRAALAERAAQLCLAGHGPGAVLPTLRLLAVAEALCAAPAPRAVDLNEELDALAQALTQAVRRRAGWLYLAPAAAPLPVAAPRALVQGAVLCFVRGVLASPAPARAVLCLEHTPGAARLVLRGGAPPCLPPDAPALLRRLAAVCGGTAVMSHGGAGMGMGASGEQAAPAFCAALRLPLCPTLPQRPAPTPADLLADRCGPLPLYLGGEGWLAGEEEW